jgi:hypothetical protein
LKHKKWLGWFFALLLVCLAAVYGGWHSWSTAHDREAKPPKQAATTLMIYMLGSDLESVSGAVTASLKQMLAATYSNDVNVVITTGGSNKADANDPVTDWRTVRRYALRDGKLHLLADIGKQNMVDSRTLANFIVWAKGAFPAAKYRLVFWNHGGGYNGFGADELFDRYQTMTLPGIQAALKSARDQTGIHFDLIGFDACLMAHAEVAYALMPYADYLAGSEELEPGAGWNYQTVLSELSRNPTMSATQLGRIITDSYLAFQKENNEAYRAAGGNSQEDLFVTFSILDLKRMGEVADAVRAFANALSQYVRKSTDNWMRVAVQRAMTVSFGAETTSDNASLDITDLGAFADGLAENDILPEASRLVSAAVRQVVVYRGNGPLAASASGLSIYFPSRQFDMTNFDKTYANIDFPGEYKSMLKTYVKYAKEVPQVFEVDVTRSTATHLNAAVRSNFGVKEAMLAVLMPTDVPHQLRAAMLEPLDVDPNERNYGLTASLNTGWPVLNGHAVNMRQISMESRSNESGEDVKVATYIVPAQINDKRVSLLFEKTVGDDRYSFVAAVDDKDGPLAERIRNVVNPNDMITLESYVYDVNANDFIGMLVSEEKFRAGEMQLTTTSIGTNGNELRLITGNYVGSFELSAPLRVDF